MATQVRGSSQLMAPKAADPLPDNTTRIARGPIAVSTLVGRLTRGALGARGLAGADVIAQWRNIVGPELATLATPATLKRPRGDTKTQGGTLVLRVASGAAATILQLKGPQIVERVNRYFGYHAVANLQITPGAPSKMSSPVVVDPPLPPEAMQDIARAVADVTKPELRAALTRLGAAVRRRTASKR